MTRGVVFVFGESEAVQTHRRQTGDGFRLLCVLLEAGAAQQGEIADAVGGDVHLLKSAVESAGRPVMVPVHAIF